jgi:hypothetical protein
MKTSSNVSQNPASVTVRVLEQTMSSFETHCIKTITTVPPK